MVNWLQNAHCDLPHLLYLRKPALKIKSGEQAFTHAGHAAWKSLPEYI